MKSEMMNETELKVFAEFLDILDDKLGSMGCNDYDLPDTAEGHAIAKQVADWFNEDNAADEKHTPTLNTYNWAVFAVLRKKFDALIAALNAEQKEKVDA